MSLGKRHHVVLRGPSSLGVPSYPSDDGAIIVLFGVDNIKHTTNNKVINKQLILC